MKLTAPDTLPAGQSRYRQPASAHPSAANRSAPGLAATLRASAPTPRRTPRMVSTPALRTFAGDGRHWEDHHASTDQAARPLLAIHASGAPRPRHPRAASGQGQQPVQRRQALLPPRTGMEKIMNLPSVEQIQGKWKQHVGAAKIAWGELTEDELLQTEGHVQKLTGLVQERYAISQEEADTQVKHFFNSHGS